MFSVALCFAQQGCRKKIESEKFLIPKGYTGPVTIIFNSQTGMTPEYEDGFRIYRVGKDGTLRTQFQLQEGWFREDELQFWYIDSNGDYCSRLECLKPNQDTAEMKSQPYVYKNMTGSTACILTRRKISFYEFRIGRKDSLSFETFQMANKQLNELIDIECAGK